MKKIGIVVKPAQEALASADVLVRWFEDRNVEVVRRETDKPWTQGTGSSRPDQAPPDLACIMVLGGDGAFLIAARWAGDQPIPIIGVKFGDVGFLAASTGTALLETAEAVLCGHYAVETRMRLSLEILHQDGEIVRGEALNDVVINKRDLARLAHIEAFINDDYLTTFRADGLIVSTPTGSTAYSLAAGGPMVHPGLSAMVLTPICPFTLSNRPLVLPDAVRIELRMAAGSSDIMVTLDGQEGIPVQDGDRILIRKGAHPVHMIFLPEYQYFDALKAKLMWSGGRPAGYGDGRETE
ncbi:MAG: NAD(+) kinase [Deltaproteobacteria bacterium]|nr:MAG: NAD(+) kinase [Deltaproteobacteria bacterium]